MSELQAGGSSPHPYSREFFKVAQQVAGEIQSAGGTASVAQLDRLNEAAQVDGVSQAELTLIANIDQANVREAVLKTNYAPVEVSFGGQADTQTANQGLSSLITSVSQQAPEIAARITAPGQSNSAPAIGEPILNQGLNSVYASVLFSGSQASETGHLNSLETKLQRALDKPGTAPPKIILQAHNAFLSKFSLNMDETGQLINLKNGQKLSKEDVSALIANIQKIKDPSTGPISTSPAQSAEIKALRSQMQQKNFDLIPAQLISDVAPVALSTTIMEIPLQRIEQLSEQVAAQNTAGEQAITSLQSHDEALAPVTHQREQSEQAIALLQPMLQSPQGMASALEDPQIREHFNQILQAQNLEVSLNPADQSLQFKIDSQTVNQADFYKKLQETLQSETGSLEQVQAQELAMTQASEALNSAVAENDSSTAPMADELREAIASFDQDMKAMEDYLAQLKATKQNPEEWNKLSPESKTKINSQIIELETSIAAIKKSSAPTLNRARQVSGAQQQLSEKIEDIQNQNTTRAREKSFTVRKWNKLIEFLKARFVEVKADPAAVKEALSGLAARIQNLRQQANEQAKQLTLAPAPIYENIEDIAEQVAVTLNQTQNLFDELQKMQSSDQSIEQKIMLDSIIKVKDELQRHQDKLQEYSALSKEELAALLQSSLETLQQTLPE